MTNETAMNAEANRYLAQLRTALTGMKLGEREDIVEEIKMHICERSGDGHTNVGEILGGLGPADELAKQYCTGRLLQEARTSTSPLVILRATLRWARTGVGGTMVFVIALFGYVMAVGFLLLALLKPLFPQRTGLWVGPGVFDFSFRMGLAPFRASSGVHEVLGWWFIPVCLILGSLGLLLTNKLIQILIERFRLRLPFTSGMNAHVAMTAS